MENISINIGFQSKHVTQGQFANTVSKCAVKKFVWLCFPTPSQFFFLLSSTFQVSKSFLTENSVKLWWIYFIFHSCKMRPRNMKIVAFVLRLFVSHDLQCDDWNDTLIGKGKNFNEDPTLKDAKHWTANLTHKLLINSSHMAHKFVSTVLPSSSMGEQVH